MYNKASVCGMYRACIEWIYVVILYIADGKHKIISINIEDSEYLNKLKDKDGYIDIDYFKYDK